jgi:hypothetical protein
MIPRLLLSGPQFKRARKNSSASPNRGCPILARSVRKSGIPPRRIRWVLYSMRLGLFCSSCRVPHPNVALFATLGWDSTAMSRLGFLSRT